MADSGSGAPAPARLEHVEDDVRVLRREWRFERIGWCVLALVIVAGCAGLLGGGQLAGASVVSADGRVTMDYERIVRHGAPTDIVLRLAPPAAGDTAVTVAIDQEYLAAGGVGRILPAPLEMHGADGRLVYRFRGAPGRATVIDFALVPGTLGVRRASLTTDHGTLPLRQLVLP